MCGIAGIYYFNKDRTIAKKNLDSLALSLAHRGRDGRGIFLEKNIGLAHWRLAVIDLSEKAGQPMTLHRQKVTIVHNGEIFNYQEIGRELSSKGHDFATASDTEVILHAYLEWGEACVTRFNGMWAFVIYDHRSGPKLFCSRDRLGVKPFYYLLDSERFVFASELKAFDHLDGFTLKLDKYVIWDHLVFGAKGFGDTHISGVKELEAGSNLSIDRGKCRCDHYFELEKTLENQTGRVDVGELGEMLADSIRLRLRSDVPLVTINSGGLDSSLVSALAGREKPSLYTYSVAPLPGRAGEILEGDESYYAEFLARGIGSTHKTVRYGEQAFYQCLDEAIAANDGELYHSNSIPLSLLFGQIKGDGFTVVLCGEGADEVFGGYSTHRIMHLLGVLPQFIGKKIIENKLGGGAFLFTYLDGYKRTVPLFRANFIASETADRLLRIKGGIHPDRQHLFDVMMSMPPGNALTYYEQKTYLAGLLRRADRMSMQHQVEARVPYLDYRLVQALNKIAFRKKSGIFPAREKIILKRIAAPHLPPEIRGRKKHGFSSPLQVYRKHLEARLVNLLGDCRAYSTRELWALNTVVEHERLAGLF